MIIRCKRSIMSVFVLCTKRNHTVIYRVYKSTIRSPLECVSSDRHPFGPLARSKNVNDDFDTQLWLQRSNHRVVLLLPSLFPTRCLYHFIPTAAGTVSLDTHDAGYLYLFHVINILIPRSTITFSYCVCRVQFYH